MAGNSEIRVLVADDEPLARRGVRQLLAPHRDMVVVGEARNGAETLTALDALSPDLLFLDVQMPEMDGFEVLRARGADRMPTVVFVTAHDQFAVQAFEAHALDYLVKPLQVARFEAALQRVRERLRLIEAAGLAVRLTELLDAEEAERDKFGVERLVVPIATGELVIPVMEIDWIGADDYYARLHIGAKSHLLRESLTSLEARLDPRRFARVHRSAIVQVDRIRGNLQWGEPHVHQVLDTAFAFAVMNSHFEIADFLLAHGANINTNWSSHEPASILHELVWHRNYEAMQFLIDRGIDMTIHDYRWDATAVGWAAVAAEDEKMAQWLRDAQQRREQASH